MKLEDIPKKDQKWIKRLEHGDPFIEDHVIDKIQLATHTTELKQDIISQMFDIITECLQVIQNANAMETPKECTCAGNCGDKT